MRGGRDARQLRAPDLRPASDRCAGRCRSCAPMRTRAGSTCSTRSSARASRRCRSSRVGAIDQRARTDRPAASSRIAERPRTLLVGGGVGIPPMVFLAESLKATPRRSALAAAGADGLGDRVSVPRAALDRSSCPACRAEAIACMPLLDDWGVASRLASLSGFAGLLPRLRDGPRGALAGVAGRRTTLARSRDVRVRPDADAAGHRRASRAGSACRARSRSRNSWRAPSAAAPVARCRSSDRRRRSR